MLVEENERYWRPDILSSRTQALTDNGLIQSDGELWRRQRSLLRPLFGVDRLSGYTDTIASVTDDVVGGWEDNEMINLHREMAAITVRVIASELLGTELDVTMFPSVQSGIAALVVGLFLAGYERLAERILNAGRALNDRIKDRVQGSKGTD